MQTHAHLLIHERGRNSIADEAYLQHPAKVQDSKFPMVSRVCNIWFNLLNF